MGVERSVTRWYLQRQTIQNELAVLHDKLSKLQAQTPSSDQLQTASEREILQQYAQAQEKLKLLGPCPKPMMG